MSKHRVVLLLGSNLGNRKKYLSLAKEKIRDVGCEIIFESKIIETEPVGFQSNNSFLNQAIEIECDYSPLKLLKITKEIEIELGRIHKRNDLSNEFKDRKIDIDLLTFDKITYNSFPLKLPHHQIFSRNFVKKLMNFSR